MIILDTNVLSELLRPVPEARVLAWLDEQDWSTVWLTAIAEAELLYGLAIMPRGRRRESLSSAVNGMLAVEFRGRILPFDSDCARIYAEIAARRRGRGMPISQSDAQIAAIVRRHQARLATRNGRDFSDCGVDLIDPWQMGG